MKILEFTQQIYLQIKEACQSLSKEDIIKVIDCLIAYLYLYKAKIELGDNEIED